MPRIGNRRKKTRTHIPTNHINDSNAPANNSSESTVPRHFVITQGSGKSSKSSSSSKSSKSGIGSSHVDPSLSALCRDFRQVCAPNSYLNLKATKQNRLRDFTRVASDFGVSHISSFTQTPGSSTSEGSCYLKIGKFPRGPTLTFRLKKFSLMKDVKASQSRPRDSAHDYLSAPILLLNGFKLNQNQGTNSTNDIPESATNSKTLQLVATCLKHMFPPVDVNTFTVKKCRRVIFFNYCDETKELTFRHYSISEDRNAGVSRSIKKLIKGRVLNSTKVEKQIIDNDNMSDCDSDVGDYLLEQDSDEEKSIMKKPSSTSSAGSNLSAAAAALGQNVAVHLQELGPRMTLELHKGEEGFYEGSILFQEFLNKTLAVGNSSSNLEEQAKLTKKSLDLEAKKKLIEEERLIEEKRKEEAKRNREKAEERKKRKQERERAAELANGPKGKGKGKGTTQTEQTMNSNGQESDSDESDKDLDYDGDDNDSDTDVDMDQDLRTSTTGTISKKQKFNPMSWANKKNKSNKNEEEAKTVEFTPSASQKQKTFMKNKKKARDARNDKKGGGSESILRKMNDSQSSKGKGRGKGSKGNKGVRK